jgi:hypothetical protein
MQLKKSRPRNHAEFMTRKERFLVKETPLRVSALCKSAKTPKKNKPKTKVKRGIFYRTLSSLRYSSTMKDDGEVKSTFAKDPYYWN